MGEHDDRVDEILARAENETGVGIIDDLSEALTFVRAERDDLKARNRKLRLAYIEATNPGIDMAEVERTLDVPDADPASGDTP